MTRFEQIKNMTYAEMVDFFTQLKINDFDESCVLDNSACLETESCCGCIIKWLSTVVDKPHNCWRCGGSVEYDSEHHMIICESCGVRSRPKKMSEDYVTFLKEAWNDKIQTIDIGEEK